MCVGAWVCVCICVYLRAWLCVLHQPGGVSSTGLTAHIYANFSLGIVRVSINKNPRNIRMPGAGCVAFLSGIVFWPFFLYGWWGYHGLVVGKEVAVSWVVY